MQWTKDKKSLIYTHSVTVFAATLPDVLLKLVTALNMVLITVYMISRPNETARHNCDILVEDEYFSKWMETIVVHSLEANTCFHLTSSG